MKGDNGQETTWKYSLQLTLAHNDNKSSETVAVQIKVMSLTKFDKQTTS